MSPSSPLFQVVSICSLPDDILLAVTVELKRGGSFNALEYYTKNICEHQHRDQEYIFNADLLVFVGVYKL